MTELGKYLYEVMGSMVLNKKQVAKLIGKSVPFIDAAIHQNRKERIPLYSKENGGVEFSVMDVADFLEQKSKKVS